MAAAKEVALLFTAVKVKYPIVSPVVDTIKREMRNDYIADASIRLR
jgi:hypothetical protein